MYKTKKIFPLFFIILFASLNILRAQTDTLADNYKTTSLNSEANKTQLLIQSNDKINEGRQTLITKTVAEVSPAVVGITATQIQQYTDMFRLFIYNQKVQGMGSGIVISPDGYILTNDHVAGNAVEATVTMTDGKQYNAKIIGTDQTSDICLLKIDAHNLPYIKLGNSDDILIGEWVIALGNPFGLFNVSDKPTVTVGVVSATNMNLGASENRYYVNMIQTDAAINQGNSGGPLVNAIGELIGMNTLIYTADGSAGNVGVGFAIPANKIKRVVNELKKNGKVDRDFWTGLSVMTNNPRINNAYDLGTPRGVIITGIAKNSPAQKAGLKLEDVILDIDNYMINDQSTMIGILQEYRTGDVVSLKLIRDKKEITLKMTLEKRK